MKPCKLMNENINIMNVMLSTIHVSNFGIMQVM